LIAKTKAKKNIYVRFWKMQNVSYFSIKANYVKEQGHFSNFFSAWLHTKTKYLAKKF